MQFRNMATAISLAALGLLVPFATHASSVVFQEDFSGAVPGGGSEAGGAYGGPIAGTQFTAPGGNVDIVGVLNATNFSCIGNPGGNCVDLIGNQAAGGIVSTVGINLTAGATYTISYVDILQGFPTGDSTPVIDFDVALGTHVFHETADPTVTAVTLSFVAGASELGALLGFGTTTAVDTVHGPVISDIKVTENLAVSTTPLPAALPLFATGLGAVGLLARRRKRKAARAAA